MLALAAAALLPMPLARAQSTPEPRVTSQRAPALTEDALRRVRQHACAIADDAHALASRAAQQAQTRLAAAGATIRHAAQRRIDAHRREPTLLIAGDGPTWAALPPGASLPPRVVLLVHGLDEAGGVWDDLAPALRQRGHTAIALEYPNDDAIARSADVLADALATLRRAGVQRVDIVAHSMGGLLARDVLTRTEHYAGDARGTASLPAIQRLIMLGTPNQGSDFARLRTISEAYEALRRARDAGRLAAALTTLTDGNGQAGIDLRPGSAFLDDLNARPRPTHVRITAVVGSLGLADAVDFAALQNHLERLVDSQRAQSLAARAALLSAEASTWLGDGLVSIESAAWPHADRIVILRAGHRGMIARQSPDRVARWLGATLDDTPAIPLILRELDAHPQTPPAAP